MNELREAKELVRESPESIIYNVISELPGGHQREILNAVEQRIRETWQEKLEHQMSMAKETESHIQNFAKNKPMIYHIAIIGYLFLMFLFHAWYYHKNRE